MHPLSVAMESLAKLESVRGVALFEVEGEALWLNGEFANNQNLYKSTGAIVAKLDSVNADQTLLNFTKAKVYCTQHNGIGIAIITDSFSQTEFEAATHKFYELYSRYAFSSTSKSITESVLLGNNNLPLNTIDKLIDVLAGIVGVAGKILFRDSVRLITGNPDVLGKDNIENLRELINLILDNEDDKRKLKTKWDAALK